jgi:alpha-L-arabinofuranosidase
MRAHVKTSAGLSLLLLVACWFGSWAARAQSALPVYTDSLVNGFQDWGWATRNYANTSPVHSGSDSIAVSIDGAWQGLQIWHPDLDSSLYTSISFWLNGGTNGGQQLQVYGLLHIGTTNNAATSPRYSLDTLQANTWLQFTVPLSALGVANTNNFTGFVIQDRTGGTQPIFFVDDIQLNPVPSLTHLSIDATQSVRSVDARWFGVNTAIWDGNFDTSTTISLLKEMGNRILRAPGGSLSDEYDWSTDKSLNNTWTWVTSFGNFVHVATNVGSQAFITVNYGTGTSNQAAAWVAYANGWSTNTQSLGVDQYGRNWQTVGYWASLRSANKLGTDDGKNFLRISRPTPFGFKYWELGNECYGTWETDYNTNAPYNPHEGWSYATRTASYAQLMRLVDPTIKIGVVVTPGEDSYANGYSAHTVTNPRTGQEHNGWTPVMLTTLRNLGFTPDFAVHHVYPEWTNPSNPANSNDNDDTLLQYASHWANDAGDLRQQLTDYLGAVASNVELVCTENNSDSGAQGRQSTSLVNGLYYADSFAQLAQTEFNALVWWDLRNGTDTSGNFDPSLYGWRTYGDLGVINGLATRHPAFYAAKLMQYFAQPGDTILPASSDYSLVSVYAARRASGALSVLVLNKDKTSSHNTQIALTGFAPGAAAILRSYGIPQDEAARTNGPAAAQDLATNIFPGVALSFNFSAPPLSLSLFTLSPEAPTLAVPYPASPGGPFVLQVQGQPNVRYILQSATSLNNWADVATNTLTESTWNFTNSLPPGPGQRFWRAVWMPY